MFLLGFITVKEQCDYCRMKGTDACCKNVNSDKCNEAQKNPNMLTVTATASQGGAASLQSGLSQPVIIGIVVGSVFLAIFLGFLFFFYRSVKHSTAAIITHAKAPRHGFENAPTTPTTPLPSQADYLMQGPSHANSDPRDSTTSFVLSTRSEKPPIYLDMSTIPRSPGINSGILTPSSTTALKSHAFFSSDESSISEVDEAAESNEYLVIISFGKLFKFVSYTYTRVLT
jgi:hypothetical protein